MHQPHVIPYCIIAKIAWGQVRTMRVPEAFIERVQRHGWTVLIRDSEMPPYTPQPIYGWFPWQSNPHRYGHHEDREDGA